MQSPSVERLSDALLQRGDGAHPALIDGDGVVTYTDLRARVGARRDELGLRQRSLVLLTGGRTVEWVVTYLALLEDHHVPLLGGDQHDQLATTWNPDAAVDVWADGLSVSHSPSVNRDLHPDLALLLSTSGSTGSPKLVRLSHRNLVANAEAIGDFLGLREEDRGIASLPVHYCYGLSVLHSHLAAGASMVCTEASVVDPCFAAALRRHQVTNVAGVPHSFDMLERTDPERLSVPSLRLLTCAGGAMAVDAVTRWSDRCARWGADLVLMYGQTEATARMAYLPPALVRSRPNAIGVPIPGGDLRIDPVAGSEGGVGELVYSGPNVMMGYATTEADLAAGHDLTELRTGDLARVGTDGLFEIVGRRSRFIKPFGVRIDLDRVQALARDAHGELAVTGDDTLLACVAADAEPNDLRRTLAAVAGLPTTSIEVVTGAALPRTSSGKVDQATVLRLARDQCQLREQAAVATTESGRAGVATLYGDLFGIDDIEPGSTFVSAGGDSLDYVECSMRLESLIGRLPPEWHLMTVQDLETWSPTRQGSFVDTTFVLRAVGICTVVATHMKLGFWPGGAHLMLAVVGFNLSRFQLTNERPRDWLRAAARTMARTALPAVAWGAAFLLVLGAYSFPTLLLVNNYAGPASHDNGRWHFWFIEAFVQIYIVVALLMSVPWLRRLERRFRYGFPFGLLLLTLALVPDWHGLSDPANLRFRTHGVAFFFVLGWLIHRSERPWQLALTSVACVASVHGFFGQPGREAYIIGGLLLLTWARTIPFPRRLIRPLGQLSGASLWIFITHFRIWPTAAELLPLPVAYVVTILAGIAIWHAFEATARAIRQGRAVGRFVPGLSARRGTKNPGRTDRSSAEHPPVRSDEQERAEGVLV